MAKVTVTCPGCGRRLAVDETHLGKRGRCKRCRTSFVIESQTGASEAAPAGEAPQVAAAVPPAGEADVPAEWEVGDVILDLYEVRGVHTGGGMGLVYRVRHRGWDVDLAVKSPRPESFRTDRQRDNFIRECETWVDLGLHPHTVSCHYVRVLGGIPRVFAEYVEGGSLRDWIRDGRLYEGGPAEAPRRILDVAIQVAWGLAYAHEKGLVHQDVKPANVLMAPDPSTGSGQAAIAKVTDFGLARARPAGGEAEAAETSRDPAVTYGGGMTPAYCSPEQARKDRLSPATDIWSWGLSVLAMFAGGCGWQSGQVAPQALAGYLKRGPADEAAAKMPDAVAELLARCFRRDPAERPADMAEIAASLIEACAAATGETYTREPPKPADLLADGLNNRALSLLDLGKPQDAEETWRQALSADPHHLESTYNLGLTEWRGARIDDVTLRRRLKEAGTTAEPWRAALLLAHACLEADDCESAIALLEGADAPEAQRPEVQSLLARARHLLPTSRRCLRTFEGHKSAVASVCLSTDGRYALSGSHDNTLKLWDVSTGACLRTFEGHTDVVTSVFLSTGGRHGLSGSKDSTLKFWDVSDGACLRTCEGHQDDVTSVCLSADGRHALSGSRDKTLKLWEVSAGACLRTFEGHANAVTSVSLSADGRHALSGSDDKTLKLWDVSAGTCLRTFEGHAEVVKSVCLSGDERYALSGSWDKTVKLWRLDWELEDREQADWDDGARPYVEVFLTQQTPYAGALPMDREPTDEEVTLALTRRGRPSWDEADFTRLLDTLGCAGLGWLRPEGVRRELERMAADWTGPPPLGGRE